MGTRERRQREVADREQLFLAKARELILHNGLLNLQMARVADACDYATGTLYQHFASKEDLLVALLNDKVAARATIFERASGWNASTRERIFAVALGDMLFARRYPEYFRLAQYVYTEVVWGAASAERRAQALEACRPISAAVFRIFEDAVQAGDLEPRGLSAAELMVGPWTLCLGMHTLVHTEGLLQQYEVREPYGLLMRHVQCLLNGYGWRPLGDPADSDALNELIRRISHEVFDDLCIARSDSRSLD
jgi:AcrR family transcriptional regulator